MKTFVISLERAADRRAHMAEELAAAGLPFTFFPAVDGLADPPPAFPRYDTRRALHTNARELLPGELGCYASHEALWKIAADGNEPLLIIEDDVVLGPTMRASAAVCERLVARYGLFRLAATRRRAGRVVTRENGLSIVRFYRGLLGTLCYAIAPDAARKLLAHSPWTTPVDEYLDKFWVHGVTLYGIMPFAAVHSADGLGGSGIGSREAGPLKRADRNRRQIYRLLDDVRCSAANLVDSLKTAVTNPASLTDRVWSR